MPTEIPLTRGRVALVDEVDFDRVNRYSWCVHRRAGRTDYAQANIPTDGLWRRVFLHRFILNAPRGVQVDHRNGDGLDCRRENIRLATGSQNQCNRGNRRGSASRFKGVTWHKIGKKWMARIKASGQDHYLGLFGTEEEAARAYDAAALLLHGEFARLNFPLTEAQP